MGRRGVWLFAAFLFGSAGICFYGTNSALQAADGEGIETVAGREASVSWPQFLGARRDNIAPDKGLLQKWPEKGPKLLQTIRGLGIGFSSISIADGRLYTMGNRGEREYVFAFDLESGDKAWEYDNGAAYHNGYGDGPRGTPTIDGDKLYALGGQGDLVCLERASGTSIWKKNLVKDFGTAVPTWGICESVLIDGDRLICTPGASGATLAALNKLTGEVVWKGASPGGDRLAYASILAIEVGSVKQYVNYTATGVISLRADDGKFLWRDDSSANGIANCCAPVFDKGMLFTASGYGKGGSMLLLTSKGDETKAQFKYHTNDLKVHHGGLVLLAGHVYGSNDPGILTCVDLKTGKTKWQNRSVGKGSLTCADGLLFYRSEQGPVALVQATPTGYKEKGKFTPPDRTNSPAWTYPVICGGRMYLRDQDLLQVYDVGSP